MSVTSRRSSSRREFSIPGDELEQHRIQLEHNLQNTDLSLHLSSGDDDAHNNESVEYPRHNSAPESFSGFISMDHHSRDNLDLDASQLHAWSIHDDEGITPYDVRTMSTAAHHASAVTITAGLRRGARREPSISGAEYDPERPLQDILAACTADSESDDGDKSQETARPKLSESLQRVGFSPRRPRNVPSRSSQHTAHPIIEASPRHADTFPARRNATPKARKSATVSFDTTATPMRRHVSQPAITQPHVNIQPPTPSTSGSRFTKMARGLKGDVRQARDSSKAEDIPPVLPAPRSTTKDAPIRNGADAGIDPNHVSRSTRKANRSRIYLPDVTGLTNAVISPAKAHLERHTIRGSSSKEVEARLIASLNALHTRLNHLETENSIARRRVRELEFELEECKRDVAKERTRIMEFDDSAARLPGPSGSRPKGKEKRQKEVDLQSSKYFEIVEEKKALEALIASLRTHLSRVTSDLSSQQQLLDELRRVRESDALSLAEKTEEINQLRAEVERLAGEIEVLRNIVEEGLNERRQGREQLADEPSAVIESPKPQRFIDDDELDRISVELDERRSERMSNSSANPSIDVSPVHDEPHSPRLSHASTHSLEDEDDDMPAEIHERQLIRERQPVHDRQPIHERKPVHERPPVHERRPERPPNPQANPPFPKINSGHLERLFFSAPRHNAHACRMCNGCWTHGDAAHRHSGPSSGADRHDGKDGAPSGGANRDYAHTIEEILERMDRNGGKFRPGDLPPQTVLARVVGELEDEFSHFREVYGNLAEEYQGLDSATQSAERRVVGDHLRDVIEILERKGSQISSLYDLLIFKDKPVE